ncbi:MAG: plasmid stabilization protein [Deltaproteobacteria bacterium]|nr:plasmid stabilization protein [Deltaproteobacteria bacterium]
MAQILIRRLDDEALGRLRSRAAREGRSLEEECRLSLVAAATRPDLLRAVEAWRAAWPAIDDDSDPFGELRPRGSGREVDLS